MRRLIVLLALCTLSARATVTVVQGTGGTSSTLTLSSNTTIGNALGVVISSGTANTGTVKIGTQTLTKDGQCAPAVASLVMCAYYTTNLTVASNSVTCTSCGTFNFIAATEFSGTNGVEPVVGCASGSASSVCQSSASAVLGIQYRPGYSAEGILFGATCSGSSTGPTVNGLSGGGSTLQSGNPAAWGVSSGTTLTSMVPSSGCNQSNAIGIAFTGTGATQQPSANPNQQEYSAVATSGNATLATTVLNSGDLVLIYPWCISSCGITTLTLGAQNATCPGSTQGTTNASAGQPGICYVITNTSGALTITFTPSGSPSQYQLAYQDYTISSNTTVSFDTGAIANCTGSCTEGLTVTTPSITPSNTGSLLANFVSTLNHTSGTNSPWTCFVFIGNTDTLDCTIGSTKNSFGWIRSSAAGSTSPNMTIITSNDPFQSIVASFKLSAPATATIPQVFVIHP